ncbi:MAG: hypothetical protein PHF86_05065 [Candidatus Nanoarchaeia archaeon]|jgi:hypothetical protein|nr:hypothetical protein [Candidatus Nanoarchaeia archaeon]
MITDLTIDTSSDLDKFIALYNRVGIKPELEKHEHGTNLMLSVPNIVSKRSKIQGHAGFYTILYFDINGKFKYQEIKEPATNKVALYDAFVAGRSSIHMSYPDSVAFDKWCHHA